MQKVDDVKIKLIDYHDQLGDSRLEFKISGKNIDYVVMNTIRRTIFSDIPIHAFDSFKIDKNNSIYHNNYLKLRLKNMPIWGVNNTIDFINKKEKINNNDDIIDEENEDELDKEDNLDLEEKEFKLSTVKHFTIYINTKNTSNEDITVSTANAKFYYDENNIVSPYRVPIPIVKLKPQQEIVLSAISNIGTESSDTKYSAVCINYYKQINDNEYDYAIESRGQINEKRIIEVALLNIEKHLNNFKKLMETNDNIDNEHTQGMITVNDMDHTFGNLISRGMQEHKNIDFAGYNLPHPLSNIVNFHYKLNKGKIKVVLNDVCDYYIELFNNIKKTIKKSIS